MSTVMVVSPGLAMVLPQGRQRAVMRATIRKMVYAFILNILST
jgi:hypothetical protein